MNPPNYDHCLRPAFTARIAKELLEQRRPINLVGKPGQGRGRLLDDLMRTDPDGTLWLCADLKAHRYGLASLLEALWVRTDLAGDPPDSLGGLVDRLADDDRRVCLLLHHLDAILNTPDVGKGFDVEFLDALNALKNRGISLLCVTERTHDRYLMMTQSGERRVSTLVLEPEDMRPFSRAEINLEIGRRLPSLSDQNLDRLAALLLQHSLPLPFLTFVQGRIQDDDAAERAFKKRLSRWEDAFKSRRDGIAVTHALALRHLVTRWCRALGCNRIKLPLTGFLKQLGHWIAEKDYLSDPG